MVNVYRCILASCLLLNYFEKDGTSWEEKKKSPYDLKVKLPHSPKNSFEKTNENNTIIFSSIFTFSASVVF